MSSAELDEMSGVLLPQSGVIQMMGIKTIVGLTDFANQITLNRMHLADPTFVVLRVIAKDLGKTFLRRVGTLVLVIAGEWRIGNPPLQATLVISCGDVT